MTRGVSVTQILQRRALVLALVRRRGIVLVWPTR